MLADLPWKDISALSLLLIAVFLIFLGRLVPRNVVEDIRADRDARLVDAKAETAEWKAAAQEYRVQTAELLTLAHTVNDLLAALRKVVDDSEKL